jgi:hypothetical protein
MQIEARFRRRTKAGEQIQELHHRLLKRLAEVNGFWAQGKSTADADFDQGVGESASVDLSPCLLKGMKGAISYASRLPASVVDKATSDDVMTLWLDAEEMDVSEFCRAVFPALIEVFEPYRAAVVTDIDVDLDDFEDICKSSQDTGRDVDGRDGVYRFWPANYFDHDLCLRAFGIDERELVKRVTEACEVAKLFENGAFILITDEILIGDELNALNEQVKRKLHQN